MRWFCAAHDFRAISLRYFNVAGATERNGEDHEPETHLMPLVLRVAAGEATHVQIHGQDYPTPDGTCIRDFIHVRDLGQWPSAGARGDRRGRPLVRGLQPRLGSGLQRARGRRGGPPRHRPRDPRPSGQAPLRRPAGAGRLLAPGAARARLAAGALEPGADAGRCLGLALGPPDGYADSAAQRQWPSPGPAAGRHRALTRFGRRSQLRRAAAPRRRSARRGRRSRAARRRPVKPWSAARRSATGVM